MVTPPIKTPADFKKARDKFVQIKTLKDELREDEAELREFLSFLLDFFNLRAVQK